MTQEKDNKHHHDFSPISGYFKERLKGSEVTV